MSIFDIDRMALEAAQNRPVIVNKFIGNIASSIAPIASAAAPFIPGIGPEIAGGADLAAMLFGGGAQGQGQANASAINGFYSQALRQLLNSTGSPAATAFANEEKAALTPLFNQQQQQLAAKEAAMGITGSGAAKADFSDLASGQASALANAIAPLYTDAIGAYGSILGGGANAQSGAYLQGLQDYYNSQNGTGSFLGSLIKPGSSSTNPGASDMAAIMNNNPYTATFPTILPYPDVVPGITDQPAPAYP